MSDLLTCTERSRLDQHEATVEAGLAAFDRVSGLLDQITAGEWERWRRVGAALETIKEERLYRPETWEAYCLRRWTYSDSQINKRLTHVRVLRDLAPLLTHNVSGPDALPVPNARQAGELARLPTAKGRRQAWRQVTADGRPTAARTRELVEQALASAPAADPMTRREQGDVRKRKKAAQERLRRQGQPETLAAMGRCLVRWEWLAGRLDAALRDRAIKAMRPGRAFLDSTGDWPWKAKTAVTIYPDGRTPEDRKAERDRERERHPDARQKENERKRLARQEKRESKPQHK